MSKAIYTVKTIDELAAKLTEHPIRSIKNNDLVIVSGGEYADDNLAYIASISTSPTTSLPTTVASNDGKVQWTLISRGFGDGGIPNSLSTNMNAVGVTPDGFETNALEGACSWRTLPVVGGSYDHMLFCKNGDTIYLVDGDVIMAYDTADDWKSTAYQIPDLPDESNGWVGEQGLVYSKSDGLIHIIGGEDVATAHHHTFDTSNNTFYINASTALLTAQQWLVALDDSLNTDHIYVFGKSTNTYVAKYDCTNNTWTELPAKYASTIDVIIEYPDTPGKYLIIFDDKVVKTFDTATDQWADKTAVAGGIRYSALSSYDTLTDRFWLAYYDNVYFYDALLDQFEYVPNLLADVGGYEENYTSGAQLPLGDGFYLFANQYHSQGAEIFTLNKQKTVTKIKG